MWRGEHLRFTAGGASGPRPSATDQVALAQLSPPRDRTLNLLTSQEGRGEGGVFFQQLLDVTLLMDTLPDISEMGN